MVEHDLNRKLCLCSVSFFLSLLVLTVIFTSTIKAETAFSPNTVFVIPNCNSQIRYATGGFYESATLVGDAWVFGGLNFDAVNVTGFSVSARDCNVTITGCSGINWVDEFGCVTYNITGVGSQTFGLSSLTGDGGWVNRFAVFIDGVNKTEGDGWTYTVGDVPNWPYMASHYFLVTGATTNVSIGYTAIFNPATLEPKSASQLPSPTPTVSSTPFSGFQLPEVQVIYTIALAGVVVAIGVIVFAVKSRLHPRIKR